jgi:DNA adenine methylase
VNTLLNRNTHSPLRWFGGKKKLSKYIIPLLPQHHCYVEPFGGGAHVMTLKQPSKVDVYNDIDCDLINFLLVLRERKDDLIKSLSSLPTSRYLTEKWQNEPLPECDFERAVRWFYILRQTIVPANNQKSGWRSGKVKNTAADYQNSITRLESFEQRMSRVMIECMDFREIIDRYDSPETTFFIDPPYFGREGMYKGGFTEKDHIELAEILNKIKGKALVTYYHHPLIDSLYKSWNVAEINCVVGTGVHKAERGEKKKRETEVMFMNYNPQYSLF